MPVDRVLEVGSTVIVAGVAVAMGYSWFQGHRLPVPSPAVTWETTPMINDWEAENQLGIRVGPSDATVVISEFIDFQCPFCARLAPVIDSIRAGFPEEVAVVYHHFPLSIHEQAVPSAVAAECAARQGRFRKMHDALFADQARFSEVAWEEVAEVAGVPDISRFSECIAQPPDSFPRIQQGRDLGERTGVTGTPTTWINGRVFRPTLALIRRLLEEGGA